MPLLGVVSPHNLNVALHFGPQALLFPYPFHLYLCCGLTHFFGFFGKVSTRVPSLCSPLAIFLLHHSKTPPSNLILDYSFWYSVLFSLPLFRSTSDSSFFPPCWWTLTLCAFPFYPFRYSRFRFLSFLPFELCLWWALPGIFSMQSPTSVHRPLGWALSFVHGPFLAPAPSVFSPSASPPFFPPVLQTGSFPGL